jgi:hypothetical protein
VAPALKERVAKPNPIAARAVRIARTALGTPYKYGGIAYDRGVDCSGLTYVAYQRAGHPIPRTSYDQFKIGSPVEKGSEIPGDLIFSYREAMGPGHVVMSIGRGNVIAADHTGTVVRIEPASIFDNVYVGSRRVLPSDGTMSMATAIKTGGGTSWMSAFTGLGKWFVRAGMVMLGVMLIAFALYVGVMF